MGFKRLITYVCMMLLAAAVSASPARRGPVVLTQPDGTSFLARIQGDEFQNIKTTAEGQAIMQDAEGWWCYATFESDGSRFCSGWRVGQTAPADVLSVSAVIPRAAISQYAADKRSAISRQSIPFVSTRSLFQSRAIVILAQFKDINFVNTREDFISMLTAKGYDRYGATGSAKDYFEYQFNGMVDFIFDVSEIVTLPAQREYYGGNDSRGNDLRPAEMVADACALAAQAGVDFSRYDTDNDGFVDNVFVFFAGEDEAEGADENSIWSHSWYLFRGAGMSVELNGKMIDRYACSSEMTRIHDMSTGKLLETRLSGIGTFCHEFSHTFGLPDLYDTDYEDQGGWAAGTWGSTSLMDSGNQNNLGNTPPNYNAIEREILGLSSPVVISADGKYSLSPINTYGEFYRIDTDVENEYYLIECRSNVEGNWDEHIGGSGMLVYHIDKSGAEIDRWQGLNTVNAVPGHQCADLVEADGRSDIFSDYMDYITRTKNLDGIFFPNFSTNSLQPSGTPGLNFWSGANESISIINIEKDEAGKVSFNVIGFAEDSTPPSVKGNIQYEAFCDGAIISFESDRPFEGEALISFNIVGKEAQEISVMPYEEGRYAVLLEGLESVRTYTVSVNFIHNDIKGSTTSMSFMTKKKPSVSWPHIASGMKRPVGRTEMMNKKPVLDEGGRLEPGTRIPLKINNTNGVKDILWFFNGQPVTHEGDYYFTLNDSGILKAHLYMEDGQEYIIVKEIKLVR